MAKVWVLDAQTKGTGANMVPLERVLRKRGANAAEPFVLPELKPLAPEEEPPKPHVFKLVDVMTRQVLGEAVDARAAVSILEDIRSIVDVRVYVWDPKGERWRTLTFGETQILWEHRGRRQELPAADRAVGSGIRS